MNMSILRHWDVINLFLSSDIKALMIFNAAALRALTRNTTPQLFNGGMSTTKNYK